MACKIIVNLVECLLPHSSQMLSAWCDQQLFKKLFSSCWTKRKGKCSVVEYHLWMWQVVVSGFEQILKKVLNFETQKFLKFHTAGHSYDFDPWKICSSWIEIVNNFSPGRCLCPPCHAHKVLKNLESPKTLKRNELYEPWTSCSI